MGSNSTPENKGKKARKQYNIWIYLPAINVTVSVLFGQDNPPSYQGYCPLVLEMGGPLIWTDSLLGRPMLTHH